MTSDEHVSTSIAHGAPARGGREALHRQRVLIVDDDPAIQELVALLLHTTCDLTHASTGAEALHVVRGETLAAVVLDYRLPDLTGLQVLSELRSVRPCLPVIMVTAYGSESVCAAALKLGIQDYFSKPFNVFELRQSVLRVISGDLQRGGPCEPAPRQPDLAIQKTVLLIQQRYWDRLTLAGLAREVGLSRYGLSHRFRAVMGMTLRGYLLRERLEKAKELLTGARIQVTEVALTVGFGDLPRFDKLFKRYTGVTPSAYRDNAPANQ
jgi:YesN/AraC family two-component response regulator